MQESLGRKIMIPAKVNGVTARCLVDTGNRQLLGCSPLAKTASMVKEPLRSVFGQIEMVPLVIARIQRKEMGKHGRSNP